MAEGERDKNPLKALESIGKEVLGGLLDNLVKRDVLKLEESEKKKFNDAKPGDKAWVLVDAVRQKRHIAGQVLVQTFLNTDKNSTPTEDLSNKGQNGPHSPGSHHLQ
uniref:CARD domain-containing protein n=1 Tax=Molossus molossus TaxID=27622 RepID=A0A7J8EQZ3_MOLMO|nr:hypothetical protein HJG59_008627 [Molossus molossus]